MIVRIVKVTLLPGRRSDFISLFHSVSASICNMPGCQGVEVFNDNLHPDIAFTLSSWNSPNDLENYRMSELFATTWSTAKQLFASRAEAWSLEPVNNQPDTLPQESST